MGGAGGMKKIRKRGVVNTDLWKLTTEQQQAIHDIIGPEQPHQ
jgi:hypothetical protein